MSQEKRDGVSKLQEDEFDKTLPGKGAITTDYYKVKQIPKRFEKPDNFKGYNNSKSHPMYMTSAMEYGANPPTVHTMPTSFHGKSQKFSNHLGQCGMYRNHSLNTAMDISQVSNNDDGTF